MKSDDKKPFIEALKAKDFMSQVEKVIAESMGFSNINSHSFAHGRSWTYLQEGASGFQTKTGQMALQRQDVQVEIGRILKCDSKLLPEFLLGELSS